LALFNHFIEAPKAAIVPKIGAAQTVTVALAGWAKISDSILIRLRAVTANTACFNLPRIDCIVALFLVSPGSLQRLKNVHSFLSEKMRGEP
jgi:hypothetical protein